MKFIARVVITVMLSFNLALAADDTAASHDKTFWVVQPMAGVDRNELSTRDSMGQPVTETDTGPEYGIFALFGHPNFVINNFLFYSDVNDSDVWGDLFFANYYVNSKDVITWNAGAGYLWHLIETPDADITVNTPMVKTGPRIKIPSLHITLNPYLGYAWERVEVELPSPAPGIDQDNDSFLYGLTASWRWRMLESTINYYYQDSQEIDDDFNVLRGRINVAVDKNWGVGARVDYMEHSTSKDTSVLVGPFWVF